MQLCISFSHPPFGERIEFTNEKCLILLLSVDSYAQRAEARKALSQDETWINNYIKKMLKMLVKQVLPLMTETYNDDDKQGSRSLCIL